MFRTVIAAAILFWLPHQSPQALQLRGDGIQARSFSLAELAAMPHREMRVKGHHDSTTSTYSGIVVDDLLKLSGISADSLRRARSTMYVVVEAADGYRMLFSLAELDPSLSDKVVLLVDKQNGKPLPDASGPLRLIVPDEKREARWVRQVRGIVVKRASSL